LPELQEGGRGPGPGCQLAREGAGNKNALVVDLQQQLENSDNLPNKF
jgi:hypothetical protein